MGFSISPGPQGRPHDRSYTYGWTTQTSGWASRPLPDLRVGIPTPPGHSGGTPDPTRTYVWASRTSGSVSRPLPDRWVVIPDFCVGISNLRVGLLTLPRPPDVPPDPSQTTVWAS